MKKILLFILLIDWLKICNILLSFSQNVPNFLNRKKFMKTKIIYLYIEYNLNYIIYIYG